MLNARDLHKFLKHKIMKAKRKNISCRENQNGSGVALYQTKTSGKNPQENEDRM